MTAIAAADAGLVRLLTSCGLPGVVVESAPHDWSPGYQQRLLTVTPAILVCFTGANEFDDGSTTTLDLAGKWRCVVVVGWHGAGEKERRRGAGGGMDLLHRASAAAHGATLREENGNAIQQSYVTGLEVLADSATDLSNLWIAAFNVTVRLPLPLLEGDACYGPLDDFLKVRGPLVMPDPADDVDLAVDLPQT